MLSLMAQGRMNIAIASTLTISPGVVEKHVASIFTKLGQGAAVMAAAGIGAAQVASR